MAGIWIEFSAFIPEKDLAKAKPHFDAIKSAGKALTDLGVELGSDEPNHTTKAFRQHVCRHDENKPCDHKQAITATSEILKTKEEAELEER